MIEPIGDDRRRIVVAQTEDYIRIAEAALERSFRPIPVRFDLRGSTAGMFRAEGRHCEIRYNPWVFARHWEHNLHGTVPHEVAHYVVHEVYGFNRVRPHGEEWQALMHYFGAEPEVTFKLPLDGVPQRRQRTHPYRCACREHAISSTRHNRVRRGTGEYRCRYCNTTLVYAPD